MTQLEPTSSPSQTSRPRPTGHHVRPCQPVSVPHPGLSQITGSHIMRSGSCLPLVPIHCHATQSNQRTRPDWESRYRTSYKPGQLLNRVLSDATTQYLYQDRLSPALWFCLGLNKLCTRSLSYKVKERRIQKPEDVWDSRPLVPQQNRENHEKTFLERSRRV